MMISVVLSRCWFLLNIFTKFDSQNCKKTMINIDVLYIVVLLLSCDIVIMPAKERQQIGFLGYNHFI